MHDRTCFAAVFPFDPVETPALLAAKKLDYVASIGRHVPPTLLAGVAVEAANWPPGLAYAECIIAECRVQNRKGQPRDAKLPCAVHEEIITPRFHSAVGKLALENILDSL